MDAENFKAELEKVANRTEAALKAVFAEQGINGSATPAILGQQPPGASHSDNENVPLSLLEAMRYAALNGGKRIRPFLVTASAALFNSDEDVVLDTAIAIECIHCYSLIHDDLPSMDNDDTRRGKPSLWKWRDEATAILAGDSLQSLAFEILSRNPTPLNAYIKAQLVNGLALAGGKAGMVGGQVRDIAAEQQDDPHSFADVIMIHAQKTGALIAFSAEAGAIIGGGDHNARKALRLYGEKLGLAFQLRDDLLDIEGSADELGKTPGKDADAGKATFISALGTEKARIFLDNLRDGAHYALEPFGDDADTLRAAADFVCNRTA